MIGSAKTLTEDEISQKEQEFIKTLQNTPIYKLFSTTDGNFDKSILDFYDNSKKIEVPENPKTENPGTENPEPKNPGEIDYCFNLDASGNYVDDVANCSNYICTITIDGKTTQKQCNVA